MPSHDRLVRLPSSPLRKRLALVKAGSKSTPSHAVSVNSLPAASSPLKEQMRVAKWGRMMEVLSRDSGGNVESWVVKASKAHKLRRRVYKGIPDRWRSAAWEVLMGKYSRSGSEAIVKLGGCYHEDLEKPSSYDIQIDLDVPRTISGHIMFRTRYGLGYVSVPTLVLSGLRFSLQATFPFPCSALLLVTMLAMWLCAGHGPNSRDPLMLLRASKGLCCPCPLTRCLQHACHIFPRLSRVAPSHLRPGTNHGIEDAKRLLCIQKTYDFHNFIRDQVVHHSFCEFRPVPDSASNMGRLSSGRTRPIRCHGRSHRMDLSRHVTSHFR